MQCFPSNSYDLYRGHISRIPKEQFFLLFYLIRIAISTKVWCGELKNNTMLIFQRFGHFFCGPHQDNEELVKELLTSGLFRA